MLESLKQWACIVLWACLWLFTTALKVLVLLAFLPGAIVLGVLFLVLVLVAVIWPED